jgi:MSHA biogenesis protein MshP
MKSANRTPLGLTQGAGRSQAGFTLITALFLLIVVAGLSVYMITIRNVQQSTVVFAQQGARAMLAARAGIEWGIYESVVSGNCNDPNPAFSATGTALSAYSITVVCTTSAHIEAGVTINTYVLTSTAETGAYGTLDYVSRRLRATVSAQPP